MQISLQSVSKRYGKVCALDNVTLTLEPGQIVSVLGANGAGKTTLLRCLSGVVVPTSGSISFDDKVFHRSEMDLRRRLAFLPDFPLAFATNTVLRHIGMVLRLYEADGARVEPPSLPAWLPFMPLLIAAMIAAPILGGYWLGFHSPFPLMQSVPVYAAFPISFDEITSVMLKASALRTLAWSPLFIGYTAILGLRVSVPFEYGIEVGIKVILVVMAWQLLAVVGHFTWNHASTSKPMTWRYILTVICGLCVVGAFTASAITMFNAATSLFKAAAIAGMFVSSVTGWALYRWRFNRGRVDLVTIPQAR